MIEEIAKTEQDTDKKMERDYGFLSASHQWSKTRELAIEKHRWNANEVSRGYCKRRKYIYERKDQVTDWSEDEVPFLFFTVIQKENRGFGEIKWTEYLNRRDRL